MYVTNKNTPPPFGHVEYFERSSDPFNPSTIMAALGCGKGTVDKTETGWMANDWIENPIGFIPDGTVYENSIPNFELEGGYFKDGRIFAYCLDRDNSWLKKRHTEYRQQRGINIDDNGN